jgi:predicted Zn-dependent peptidase
MKSSRSDALLALSALILGAAAAGAQTGDPSKTPAAGQTSLAPIDTLALANGLRILVLHDAAAKNVNAGLWVGAGWVHNPRGKEGLADLAAATDVIRARQELVAGAVGKPDLIDDLAVNVTSDHAFFSISGMPTDLDPVLATLRAAAIPPAEETFDAASSLKRDALINLLATRLAPNLVAREALADGLFGTRRPIGIAARYQTLLSVMPADVRAFHADYYRPSNAMLMVAGSSTKAEVRAAAERAFGDWVSTKDAVSPAWARAADSPAHEGLILIDEPDATAATVLVGFSAPGREAPEYPAVQLLHQVLGGARFEAPVAGLTTGRTEGYHYRSQLRSSARGSEITVEVQIPVDLAVRARAEIEQRLIELAATGLDPAALAELLKTRNALLASRGLESPLPRLREAASLLQAGQPLSYAQDPEGAIAALDPATLTTFWRSLLAPEDRVWVMVGSGARLAPLVTAAGIEPLRGDSFQVVTGRLFAPPAAPSLVAQPGAASTVQAEELLLAAIEAKGGFANLERVQTYAAAETLYVSPNSDMEIVSGERKIFVEYPDRFREELMMAPLQGRGVIQGVNGTHMWRTQLGKPGVMSETRRHDMLNRMWLDPFRMLSRYGEPGASISILDPDFLGGITLDGFQITAPDGKWAQYYVHPTSRLIVKRISQRMVDAGPVTAEEMFTDYRHVDGIMVPFISATYLDKEFTTEAHVSTIEINPALDRQLFVQNEGS